MPEFVIQVKTGVVHRPACRFAPAERLRATFDPAKAHLVPGVTACRGCLDSRLPIEDRLIELLEDLDGAPYPEAVQRLYRELVVRSLGAQLEEMLVAALESVAWNPHPTPEGET